MHYLGNGSYGSRPNGHVPAYRMEFSPDIAALSPLPITPPPCWSDTDWC